jgi:hypothetical protein
MEDKELRIKEYRTVEAKKKNLMGLHGKLGYILSAMGQPIIAHAEGGGLFSQTFLDDWDYQPKDSSNLQPGSAEEIMKQIPTADTVSHDIPEGWEWNSDLEADIFDEQAIGWHFDGLSRGMHIEITYKEKDKNLLVYYKGYLIFKEHAGDLKSYVPGPEWELIIERLYKSSVQILKERGKIKLIERTKKNQAKKITWLAKLQTRWGFN